MKKLPLLFLLLFYFIGFAQQTPHTIHKISADDSSWDVKISSVSPNQNMAFYINSIYSKAPYFIVNAKNDIQYSTIIGRDTDFNIIYTVTAVDKSKEKDALKHKTKSCIYVIGANKAADLNIKALNYLGAKCSYEDSKTGVNLILK